MLIISSQDESQPQMVTLSIEDVCYGRWKKRWAESIRVKLTQVLTRTPSEGYDIRSAIARFEEELAWQEALRLLARRSHFSLEIRGRLEEAGCSHSIVDKIIDKCRKAGYIDDEQRASRLVEVWRKKGYGPLKIRFELKKRAGMNAHGLREADPDTASASYVANYVKKHLPDSPTYHQKAKVIRSLMRKGFTLEIIYKAFAGISLDGL